jgi:hypothetical protein
MNNEVKIIKEDYYGDGTAEMITEIRTIEGIEVKKVNTGYNTNDYFYNDGIPLTYKIGEYGVIELHAHGDYYYNYFTMNDEKFFYESPENVQKWIALDMIKEMCPPPQPLSEEQIANIKQRGKELYEEFCPDNENKE